MHEQALKRELRCLESDACSFSAGLEAQPDGEQIADMKKQLEGRFRFLWGIYRAHSEVCLPLPQEAVSGAVRLAKATQLQG